MFMVHFVEIPIVSPVECNVAQASPCGIWYLDSGCSNHMTRNIEVFSSLDESVQTKVTLGLDNQVTVLCKGSINNLTKKGEKNVMSDVYYVFGIKHNLMSTGPLLQKGYRISMEYNHCVIMDKFPSNQLIAKIQMTSNTMFPLTFKPAKKKNTPLVVGKEKGVHSDTAFTTESVHSSNEENSACGTKKGEKCAKMKETFQSEEHDDSWLWHFRF
jgi:hypothetical protein